MQRINIKAKNQWAKILKGSRIKIHIQGVKGKSVVFPTIKNCLIHVIFLEG